MPASPKGTIQSPPFAPTVSILFPTGALVTPGGFLCPQGLSPAPLQPKASSPFPTSCCQGRRTQGVQSSPQNSPSLTLRLPEISPQNFPCLSPPEFLTFYKKAFFLYSGDYHKIYSHYFPYLSTPYFLISTSIFSFFTLQMLSVFTPQ